jgi:hypothetical protein
MSAPIFQITESLNAAPAFSKSTCAGSAAISLRLSQSWQPFRVRPRRHSM